MTASTTVKPKRKAAVVPAEPFQYTLKAFQKLIYVEVAAQMFAQDIEMAQRMFSEIPPRDGFWYLAPPRDDQVGELADLINERRKEPHDQHRIYWTDSMSTIASRAGGEQQSRPHRKRPMPLLTS